MRFLQAVFFSAAVCVFPSVPYVAGTAVDDEDDDDWSGIEVESEVEDEESKGEEEDAGLTGASMNAAGDTTLAETVDAELSDSERKIRMTLCIGIARERYKNDKDNLEDAISQMAEAANISKDQAVNELHVNMIKNCYLNLDQEADMSELTSGDEDKFDEVSARIIAPPAGSEDATGKPATLLPRQWQLINDIVEAEKNNNDDPYNEFANIGRMELIGSKMSGFQKFLYFVSVFGAVFGGGYLLVKKLIAFELEKNAKRISKKAAKKAN